MSKIELVDRFYTAFRNGDGDAMAACYAPEARFSDPVFVDLHREEVPSMWRMLLSRSTDLKVEHRDVRMDGDRVRAHWEAWYTFGRTGRKVHNQIEASLLIQDGLIVDHRDEFDLYRWTRMALGLTGTLLGWTPLVQNKVRAQSRTFLAAFMAE